MTVPPGAVAAAHAWDLAHRDDPDQPRRKGWTRPPGDQVARLLTGAAPLIAAAERERIRQLARERLDQLGPDTFSAAAAAYADILIITEPAP